MSKSWFNTDDYQICNKIDENTFEFVELTICYDDWFVGYSKIECSDYKDANGEWDSDTQDIIASYYGSLEELRSRVSKKAENQIVAELLAETLPKDMLNKAVWIHSEDDANKYLDDIIEGKVTNYL